jgi:DNA-directed RNA polymerase specialized sigma24 family protein
MEGPGDPRGPADPLLSLDIDTPAGLTRASALPRPPFIASEAWIDAFEAQCTKELYKRLKRFAAHRAHNVARAGAVVDDYYTWELVQDALADTTLGILCWDPGAKSLEAHIRDAIAARAHHDVRRARRFRHESVDVLATDAPRTMMAEIEASLHEHADDAEVDPVTRAAEVIAALRTLAAQDREVLLLLDAFAAGATDRKQVTKLTGLSSAAYRNARGRLSRLVAQLSQDDRPSYQEVPEGI